MMGGCFHLESLPWKRSANYIAKISIYYYDCITSLTYFNTPEVSHERKTESDSPFADALPLHPRRGICLRRTIFAIWIQRLALPPKRQLCRNHLSEKDASCAYRGSHAGTYCDARANRDAYAGTHRDARADRNAYAGCDAYANRNVHAETDYNACADRNVHAETDYDACADRNTYTETYCVVRANRDVHAETYCDARANRNVHAETDYNACGDRNVHAETDPDARANGSSSLYRRRLYYGFHNGARGKCISFAQSGQGSQRPFRA